MPAPSSYASSVRSGFEDWWLDERFDSVGLTEEDVPATVDQWFDRFDEGHAFSLADVQAVSWKRPDRPRGPIASRMLRQAVRDETIRRSWAGGNVDRPQLAAAAWLSVPSIRRILQATDRPGPRIVR